MLFRAILQSNTAYTHSDRSAAGVDQGHKKGSGASISIGRHHARRMERGKTDLDSLLISKRDHADPGGVLRVRTAANDI